ncbi:MAG: hypothetical protein U0525_00360 [Patescibacteria group bacterium]
MMFKNNLLSIKKKIHTIDIVTLIVVLIGFVAITSISIPYGWRQMCVDGKCGVYFADRYRARDELWHMALASVAYNSYPFKLPIYSGVELQAYHFLYSFVLHLLTLLGANVLFAHYVLFPIIWFAIFTLLQIKISKILFPNTTYAVPIFLFFSYFSSNFSYILSLRNHGKFWHDIGYFSNQPGEYLINPAFTLSILFFSYIIYVSLKKTWKVYDILGISITTFLIWGSKFYGGPVVIAYLGMVFVYKVYSRELSLRKAFIFILSNVIMTPLAIIIFYNPFAVAKSSSVFTLDPLKTIHPMVEDSELLPIRNLALARYYLYSIPGFFKPKLWVIEMFTLAVYLVFSFGTRVFGFLFIFCKSKTKYFYIISSLTTIVAISFSILFIQNGSDWFNTIQFLAYGQFLMIYLVAGIVVQLISSKKAINVCIASLVIIASFLGSLNPIIKYTSRIYNLSNLYGYMRAQPPIYLSNPELEALRFLSRQNKGVVFSTRNLTKDYSGNRIEELWQYSDTAYISALSGMQTYLTNIDQLDLMFIDYKKRLREVDSLHINLFDGNKFRYIYIHKKDPSFSRVAELAQNKFKVIFENKEVTIYEH